MPRASWWLSGYRECHIIAAPLIWVQQGNLAAGRPPLYFPVSCQLLCQLLPNKSKICPKINSNSFSSINSILEVCLASGYTVVMDLHEEWEPKIVRVSLVCGLPNPELHRNSLLIYSYVYHHAVRVSFLSVCFYLLLNLIKDKVPCSCDRQ